MSKKGGTFTTILSIAIEMFFAILPLIVLGAVWPSSGEHHPESFWSGPELSMTSCILYGLTLARLLPGAVFASAGSSKRGAHEIRKTAVSYSALTLLPFLGAVVSVILITKSVQSTGSWKFVLLSSLNLLASGGAFLILGGHAIKISETDGEQA